MKRLSALIVFAACSSPVEQAPEATAFTARTLAVADGCIDTFLFAGPRGDTKLLTVEFNDGLAAQACAAGGRVTRTYAATDPMVDLELLTGRKLSINYCTDAIQSGRRVTNRAEPLSGTVTVTYTTEAGATTAEPTGYADVSVDGVTWRWRGGGTQTQVEPWTFSTYVDIPFPIFDSGVATPCTP